MKRIMEMNRVKLFFLVVFLLFLSCTTPQNTYIDPNMDFGSISRVAVMPFVSLTRDNVVAERVRDVFINKLLATGAVYVIPVGEVARGVSRVEFSNPSAPSPEEVIKLGGVIKVQAVITGAVREYGEVRSGTVSSNVISLSLQMMETQTGKVVWTSASTRGGISILDRLFGGSGRPMNVVTEKAIDDLINSLLK